jgi:hypothetical protein
MKLVKPKHIPEALWEEFLLEKTQTYVSFRAKQIFQDVISGKAMTPDDVAPHVWSKVETDVRQRLFDSIASDMDQYGWARWEWINRRDLSALTDAQANKLKDKAYKAELHEFSILRDATDARMFLRAPKPNWIGDDDYSRLKERAEGLVNVEALESCLTSLAHGGSISAPELSGLDERSRQKLVALAEGIEEVKRKNTLDIERIRLDENKNATEAAEIRVLRPKLLRQLDIIAGLFADPTSIDRIESYDNPFADGNLQMLRRVAAVLRTSGVEARTGSAA